MKYLKYFKTDVDCQNYFSSGESCGGHFLAGLSTRDINAAASYINWFFGSTCVVRLYQITSDHDKFYLSEKL